MVPWLAALLVAGCVSSPSGAGDPLPKSVPSPKTVPAGRTDPATDPSLSRFYGQRLDWRDCQDKLQCARLTVPQDWSTPSGATIGIAVYRARGSGQRLGSLVFNPGGPGVAVEQYIANASAAIGKSLLQHFDFVGFDPRGVGGSEQIHCLDDKAMDAFLAEDATPDNPAEVSAAISQQQSFAAACQTGAGALFTHVDTLSVVKDMDVLRQALHDDVLTYYGASYGTFIGAWYAQTFPWRVGRMFLDGAVDPSLTSQQYIEGQAQGFDRMLRAYISDCQGEPACPLRGTLDQGLAQLGRMIDATDTRPLHTRGRPLTQSLMLTGITMGMYDQTLWPLLTVGLTEALSGEGTTLLRLADIYLERDKDGHYGGVFSSYQPIYCLDHAETRPLSAIEADAESLTVRYPPLGAVAGWSGLGCAVWPVKAVLSPQRLTAEGAAPILVAGTVGDPATPYAWAQALASQLSSGHLLTWESEGHTAFRRGSVCIDDAVNAYLVSGTLPAEGTRCPASGSQPQPQPQA